MADHSSDRPTAPDVARPRRHRVARTDWRLGGRTTRRWREGLLAVALITLAITLLVGILITWLWQSPLASAAATGVLWLGFAAVVVYAFRRSRPVGLLRFRGLDLLYGVALALVLRTIQGWIEIGERGPIGFPSAALIGGRADVQSWGVDIVGALAIAPVLEEFFFRGVVLVAVFSVLRRRFGAPAAGIAAVLASSGLFVLVHALVSGGDLSGVLALFLLGFVTSMLVVLTGRIWGRCSCTSGSTPRTSRSPQSARPSADRFRQPTDVPRRGDICRVSRNNERLCAVSPEEGTFLLESIISCPPGGGQNDRSVPLKAYISTL